MESIIAVNFVSLTYNINFPMACKKTDVFSKIEKKLYQEFPDLKSKKIYFVANSAVIDKSSTFEQNNIKSGNTILINDLLI
jgi:Fe-S-cluster formation regulator IscX/YfhJ